MKRGRHWKLRSKGTDNLYSSYLEAELSVLHPSVHVQVVAVHLPVLQHALSGTRLAHGLEAHIRQPDVSSRIVGFEGINLERTY